MGYILIILVELYEHLTVIEWLQTANLKPNIEKSYLQAMQEFTEYAGKGPKTILEEAEADIQKGLLMRQRRIKTELVEFRAHLQETRNAPYTIKNRMVGVKSFFFDFLYRVAEVAPHKKSDNA